MRDVVVVGAGPAGLMLACELAVAGADVVVLERAEQRSPFCRGFNLNARSLDLLDRRGLAERFLAEGPKVPVTSFGGLATPIDLTQLGWDHPYTLGIAQTRVEELLEQRAIELGVTVLRGHELRAFQQDGESVTINDGELTARWLVGCDGSRSTVRKLARIPFPGTDAANHWLLGDVVPTDFGAMSFGVNNGPNGTVVVIPRPGYVRVLVDDPVTERTEEPTLAELQSIVDHNLGRHVELTDPIWIGRFSDAARQADAYRSGRVLLAGDAAHIHPPAGAQGVNLALADATNLGWKLAAVLRGEVSPDLLDTYHSERHAAGARVLLHTQAQAVLGATDSRFAPVRELFAELGELGQVRRYLAELATGVETRYDMGAPVEDAHPWLGRLAPNLDLLVDGRPTTLSRLLHGGRGVLLDFAGTQQVTPWLDRIDLVHASTVDDTGLSALLIRPDGYTAWLATGNTHQPGPLTDSLARWFGAPAVCAA
ncbi:2-polyprenyl-6-methoxyphenol hydroxylase-like FAD-dependent oxidoreductase [Kutzneria viridogrisea]|uniref:2-polyprenyl-6-methoxyphenol hydroxylase-like FAD-dependent oxidoreductase n=1 Tax=Kutzneria viridogrisea TaxID=47990 RepID=A0ABR6BM58_9PSEU|nr:2-polyprenyl-6-methoxyphenol hydroxylase-like FAD-dependent oxidoreductase [Kutzneria viridogrisea]